MKATFKKYVLKFKQPGGTSRGVLKEKESYFIFIQERENRGIGECGILKGLSADDVPEYEKVLEWTCLNIHLGLVTLRQELLKYPSIYFGVEQALLDFKNKGSKTFFNTAFTEGKQGIPINGLIWMGDEQFMKSQISEKLKAGFSCLKMKIGAIEWETEKKLLKSIRKSFSKKELDLRVDANGAFDVASVEPVLEELAGLDVHSIEQPIKSGRWQEMASICQDSPVPIALDEELIGIFTKEQKIKMLNTIQPQYVIYKPSFIGGWFGTDEWIALTEERKVGWWITSALESNIGLNAIAQFTASKHLNMAQGLGTGGLFTNNIDSPLEVKKGKLWMNSNVNWQEEI